MVGLGPGGMDLMTSGTLALWQDAPLRFLRTSRHPSAEELLDAAGPHDVVNSFDHLYESSQTFAEVYQSIVAELLEQAERHGRLVYAVPGSPTVAETTVEMLLAGQPGGGGVEVELHAAMSFADLAWSRLGVDPVAQGARFVDGHDFARECRKGGAVLVAQCDSNLTLSDIKLSLEEPPARPVKLLVHLGLPDEQIIEVDWADIDRSIQADHLTSLWIPQLPPSAGARLDDFALLMEDLRARDAWKASQDHDSLRRFLLEESYEVLEALDSYDPESGEGADELAEELGDLLYQVVFHSSLAAQAGWFELADVVVAINDKLVSRHPHIGHGGVDDGDPAVSVEELTARWEQAKVAEQGRESAFDGVPDALPALVRAMAIAKKAGALGLDMGELSTDAGGELLTLALEVIDSGRDPEDALRRELDRVEGILRASGQ